MRPLRTILILILAAGSSRFLVAAQPAIERAAEGRLSIRGEAAAPSFAAVEDPEFLILFRNNSEEPIGLPVTSYLGAHTVGAYRYAITSRNSKSTWRVAVDPEAELPIEPAMLEQIALEPKDVYVTRFKLPGLGRQFLAIHDEQTNATSRLPVGDYELTVTMNMPGEKVTLGPINFAIGGSTSSAANKTPRPPPKASAAAGKFLDQRLALYQKANPGKPPWAQLTSASFTSVAKRDTEKAWRFEYLAEVPDQRQKIRLEIVVSEAGKVITTDAGFTVMTAQTGRKSR